MQNGERGFGQIRNASGARRNAHFIISKSIIKDRTEKGTARGGGHRNAQGGSVGQAIPIWSQLEPDP